MSGGSLNYFYSDVNEHVGDFEDRELDDLVKDLSQLFHDREWFLSGDTCEGNWNDARDAFKKKWFTPQGRQDRIEKYLSDISEEVRKSFGLSDKYCRNCAKWKPEKDKTSPYGNCKITKSCLMHRSESCDEFEKRTTEGK
jgi:hypothetical protein